MKQIALPGIDLPPRHPGSKQDVQWPSAEDLLFALAECDLPLAPPPATPEQDEDHALFPLTVLGMGLSSTLSPAHQEALEASTVLAAGQALLDRFTRLEAERRYTEALAPRTGKRHRNSMTG